MKNFKLYRNNQITQDSKIDADRADYNFLCAREDSDGCRVGKDSYFILTYNVPTGSGGTSIKIMNLYGVGTSVFLGCEIDGGG